MSPASRGDGAADDHSVEHRPGEVSQVSVHVVRPGQVDWKDTFAPARLGSFEIASPAFAPMDVTPALDPLPLVPPPHSIRAVVWQN